MDTATKNEQIFGTSYTKTYIKIIVFLKLRNL
jgi:hypothetical protein